MRREVLSGVAAKSGAQSAADDLGGHRPHNEQNGEENDGHAHLGQRHLQAQAGEKDRGEQGVGEGVEPVLQVGRTGGLGKDQSGDVGSVISATPKKASAT